MTDAVSSSNERATLVMVWLSAFSTPLMLSATNVALPSIARALHLNAVELSWIPLVYLLASAMFVLLCGRIADHHGRTRVFLVGTAGVLISSVLAASAQNGMQLLAMRFAQGVFTAALYATQIAIVSAAFPPARRGQAIGLTISSVYLGLTVGPALGGWLQQQIGWRACLLVQVPFSLIVLWMGLRSAKDQNSLDHDPDYDLPGVFLYALTLAALIVGGTSLPMARGWLLIAVAAVAAAAFIANERKAMRPMFDLRLFMTNRIFGWSCLSAFLMYTATYANVVLVGLYLQYLQGLAPAKAGLVMMTQPLTMALFAPISGRLSDRVEPRILASAGMVLTVAGLLALSMLGRESSMAHVYAALITIGMGFGLFSAPNTNAILSSVERKLYNMANSQVATMRMLGQMCSMGIIAVVFALVLGPVKITPEVYDGLRAALRLSYLTAAVFCLPAVFFSLARGSVHAADHTVS